MKPAKNSKRVKVKNQRKKETPSASHVAESHNAVPASAPFRLYQCYVCAYFTASQEDFIRHLSGPEHAGHCGERTVVCNSGDCCFRTANVAKMNAHLGRKAYHYVNDRQPAILLTLGSMSGMVWDDRRKVAAATARERPTPTPKTTAAPSN
ncbi:hypothetical protein BV898_15864 [Hypsibius exemplaris]|uniref:C2H2-type domain-containing protein n=1 Tax=Hypsibius exemplaris TaxID=2072580 RepID=A0A9X6RKR6_HYPEX|nr:hypothetical protein BV898_15864 [Hypsibius exemplaris]